MPPRRDRWLACYTQQNVDLVLQEMADLPKPVHPDALHQVDFELPKYNMMDTAIN
jgi:hypothetical protein